MSKQEDSGGNRLITICRKQELEIDSSQFVRSKKCRNNRRAEGIDSSRFIGNKKCRNMRTAEGNRLITIRRKQEMSKHEDSGGNRLIKIRRKQGLSKQEESGGNRLITIRRKKELEIDSSRFVGNKKCRNKEDSGGNRLITIRRKQEMSELRIRTGDHERSESRTSGLWELRLYGISFISDSVNFTDRNTRFWTSGFSVCTIKLPANAHRCTEISLYIQWTPICFGQSCGHLQGRKIHSSNTWPLYFTSLKMTPCLAGRHGSSFCI
jgi:hypothetical protein